MRVYLKVPTIDDFGYYQALIADPETMSYNRGYGHEGSGCYFLTEADAEQWFQRVCQTGCYLAYILRSDDHHPIGYININHEKEIGMHTLNIVIEAASRGRAYAAEALKLGAEVAFEQMNLNQIGNTLSPADNRPAAERAFERAGFVRVNQGLIVLTREAFEKGGPA